MNIVERKTDELKLYKRNAKIHSERQIELIAKSIDLTKGIRQPIVIDKDNVVVAGHGRLLAAQKLGLETVPCELVDDLTPDEVRAYRILDNELAKGQTDIDLLQAEISEKVSVYCLHEKSRYADRRTVSVSNIRMQLRSSGINGLQ